jgi:uncharacterized protein Usg
MSQAQSGGGRADRDFELQLKGYGLLTAQVFYFLPDYPSIIQEFVFQDYDEAPDYPVLFKFLDHWRREIEAAIHSVRIAHDRSLGPREWRPIGNEFTLQ